MNPMRTRKRFYGGATVRPAQKGFEIALDGKRVRTPVGVPLVVPSEALAAAIAAEWEAQKIDIVPTSMPLTQIANTAIDRVRPNRKAIRASTAALGRSDLLCQRAEAPAALVQRQEEHWGPLLGWAAKRLGARLVLGRGVMPVAQPADAIAALEAAVNALDDWNLAVAGVVAATSGSLVLALAVVKGRIGGEEAFTLAVLDEVWQNERWGEDREAAARRNAIGAELRAAARFAGLLGGPHFALP